MNLIRLILIITFFYANSQNRPIVTLVSIIALAITFIPTILKKFFKIETPAIFEIIYLMAIYGILTLGELRGFFSGLWWWSILTTLTASIALGFVSLTITNLLYIKNKISQSPLLIGTIIFSITVTFGVFWEIFEFVLDILIQTDLQRNLIETMQDISINVLGALIVSISGTIYMKNDKEYLISTFLSKIIENTFSQKRRSEKTIEEIVNEIIFKGENENVEFKSSIRTNMYTREFDKRMESEILKTIAAFLNTNGGVLLIGVDDSGKILGLDSDGFSSVDKIGLHLTNLIKSSIGNNFLPFIRFEVLRMNDKVVVMVRCKPSRTQVFLKESGEEKFFVRNGPASIKLEGSSLVDYIKHKFRDN